MNDVVMEQESDIPEMLEEAAAEIEKRDRQLELLNAQIGVLSFVDRLMAAAGNLKPPPMGEVTQGIAAKMKYRAKSMRRVKGRT